MPTICASTNSFAEGVQLSVQVPQPAVFRSRNGESGLHELEKIDTRAPFYLLFMIFHRVGGVMLDAK